MNRIDDQQRRAFMDLRHSRVLEYFRQRLLALQDRLVSEPDATTLRMLQGEAKAYRDLIKLVEDDSLGKRGMSP